MTAAGELRSPGRGIATELMLMMLSDARLPTGAHTQSAGLEAAINAGMPGSEVPQYIAARLRTVVAVEAGAAVVARYVALGPEPNAGLAKVDRAWRARTISRALRDSSVLLGRGYRRLVTRLWPDHRAAVALTALAQPCRPVVLGVAAACAGLGSGQLAGLVGYDDAQTVAAAALKIRPMDPVEATRWVIQAHGGIQAMVSHVQGLTDPIDIPAFGAPLVEQWAEIHATTTQRLFRA